MRTLGIDFGEKRTGLAISDDLGIIAKSMSPLKVKSLADAVDKIQRIIKSHSIKKAVVGLPLGTRGGETKQSIQTRYFVDALRSTNGAEIEFWNEAFSTSRAKSSRIKGSKKKSIDSTAARIILQEYLDFQKEPNKSAFYLPQYNKLSV
jgi:putative Holliday junction resolvase